MAYDDHRYLKWDSSVDPPDDNYTSTSCGDKRDSNFPNIFGEWSLFVPDDVEGSADWDPSLNGLWRRSILMNINRGGSFGLGKPT
jgi:hypothetical protein